MRQEAVPEVAGLGTPVVLQEEVAEAVQGVPETVGWQGTTRNLTLHRFQG